MSTHRETKPLIALRWASGKHNYESWVLRHDKAIAQPAAVSLEQSLAMLLAGWLSYADNHANRYESPIGHDYVLGDAWAQIGVSLRVLLNGDLGDLHADTIDSAIADALEANGFDETGDDLPDDHN